MSKQICENTKQITMSYFNSRTSEEQITLISSGYKITQKITEQVINYFEGVEQTKNGYVFTNIEEFQQYLKQGENMKTFLEKFMPKHVLETKPIKKNNRVGVPQKKNSEAQQKLHSKTVKEMCVGVMFDNKTRCIWKKTKNSCYCSRHNEKIKEKREFPTIANTKNWEFSELFKGNYSKEEEEEEIKEYGANYKYLQHEEQEKPNSEKHEEENPNEEVEQEEKPKEETPKKEIKMKKPRKKKET